MPFFKTTQNVLHDNLEYFDENWMDSNSLVLPPSPRWDYSRELKIEDVDIWEVLWMAGGGYGVYAAWCPYAEFYLVTMPKRNPSLDDLKQANFSSPKDIETFYGPGCQKKLIEHLRKNNIPYSLNEVWVEPEDMWLYK